MRPFLAPSPGLWLWLLVATAGCDEPRGGMCDPGSVQGCTCDGGGLGTHQCLDDGTGWTPCDCAPADGDADGDLDDDAGLDAAPDGDGQDADREDGGGGLTGAGPLTFIVRCANVILERTFDVDEDGDLDNAVADLGTEHAAIFALMLDAALERDSASAAPQIVHVPWVEDRGPPTDPSIMFMGLKGVDLDDPLDGSDDFSGSEPFYASHRSLDACGEPEQFVEEASLDAGAFEARGGTFAFGASDDDPMVVRNAVARGTISPGGRAGDVLLGGALTTHDLGSFHADHLSEDHSMLEIFLAGGSIVGLPAMPGLRPDLDRDGDGVESFEVDGEGHLVRCVDGDRTVIEGRDCWMDPRFEDAFSLTFRLQLVPALFAGREPGWEELVSGECTDPPEESLFDPR